MAKNQEEIVKKTTKVQIEFHGDSAVVHRGGRLPSIWDKTEKSVMWLKDKGYKPEEVEIVGDKPTCWDAIFSPPVEPITPVGDSADIPAVQVEPTIPVGDPADTVGDLSDVTTVQKTTDNIIAFKTMIETSEDLF